MICANCGEGMVHQDKPCDNCGIGYDEMIDAIRHDELIRLIERMDGKACCIESIEIEESLLACELWNAHFLVPIQTVDGKLAAMTVEDQKGKNYILIFTDRKEYDKIDSDIAPATNPFDICLDLLDEKFEGFVINIENQAFDLSRRFLERYFDEYIRC